MQNASTKRRERINSDEEERQRQGYDLESALRFAESGGRLAKQTADVGGAGGQLARLTYGHAATIWRINLGWRRRSDSAEKGFVLDIERGYWVKDPRVSDEDEPDDNTSPRTQRVVPYVEDRKNCLLIEPASGSDVKLMASLQAALKHAIEVEFQLEDNELAAQPLPRPDARRYILLYESAEGGAGVLRQLVEDTAALRRVARRALEICHFDPDTGQDKGQAPGAKEKCEAACYDCLMSYTNQGDHRMLDRMAVRDLLLALTRANVEVSPGPVSRAEHLAQLKRLCASDLERTWLGFLETHDLRLPSHAQRRIDECGTRPDFLYAEAQAAIYVDGPHHKYPDRQERDKQVTATMEDHGYTVIRFPDDKDWADIIRKHPNLFGGLA
jgi:very-short-patch-repair endonuclease